MPKLDRNRYDYHESPQNPDWRYGGDLGGRHIGIELELQHEAGYGRIIKAIPEPRGKDIHPLFEEDGTLSYDGGLEIIFPPVPSEAYNKAGCHVVRSLKALNKLEGLAMPDHAGLHINVNTNGWSDRKRGIFTLCIHSTPPDILKQLGGRRLNDYCGSQYYELECRDEDKIRVDLEDHAAWPQSEHEWAMEWRANGKSAEIRFPKATTDIEQLKLLLSYVDSLETYAEIQDANGTQYHKHLDVFPHYNKWLQAQRRRNYRAVAEKIAEA